MRKFFDRSMLPFIAIGLLNTLVSMIIMQGLDALWGSGYWLSSAIAFAITSVVSYFLNKRFSFDSKESHAQTAWRFALVIAVCYLIAYSIALPATEWAIERYVPDAAWGAEKIAMLVGQVLFTGLNYIGQRFFAFRKTGE